MYPDDVCEFERVYDRSVRVNCRSSRGTSIVAISIGMELARGERQILHSKTSAPKTEGGLDPPILG